MLGRSLRKLCIALKALADASAITVIRPAACNRSQEVHALTERNATTQAAIAPSDLSLMHLYPIDGAVRRVAKDATAWSARDATWSMVIAAIDSDPKKADDLKSWGRAYWKAVHPYNLGGGYINFMMDDEAGDRLQATFGENFERLAVIKAKYDPKNLFRVNQNIEPAVA